jgi:hypothetical protein
LADKLRKKLLSFSCHLFPSFFYRVFGRFSAFEEPKNTTEIFSKTRIR